MRRVAWVLLLAFAFAIPWEYSLDLGAPVGNVARVAGLLLVLVAIPAVLQAGRMRRPGLLQWLVLALFVWFCCSYFWTIDQAATLERLRGYFQELMIVWLVWEFVESPRDLRLLMKVFVAGCWVLALLTVADFRSEEAIAAGQFRFAAYDQDPNDVARYLSYGFPFAALLAAGERERWQKWLALGYLPAAGFAVVLTASRGGLLAASVALAGSAVLLARGRSRAILAGVLALPVAGAAVWMLVPADTLARLATIPEQLSSGDLNQRLNIWGAGWQAFTRAPVMGTGAGTFVQAAGLSSIDTAHNTALSIAVSSGLVGLTLFAAVVVCAAIVALRSRGGLRLALATALGAWLVASSIGTVEENRTTWLLLGLMAVAGRLVRENAEGLLECFPDSLAAEAELGHELAGAG
jgi:O-antigen ligase